MVTIRIKNKRIKVFNLLFLLLCICLILYISQNLIFMLPIFNSNFNYKVNTSNYTLEGKIKFKRKYFNCYVTENVELTVKEDIINQRFINDLIGDGYKVVKDNKLERSFKVNKSCKRLKQQYKNSYGNDVNFKLNGDMVYNIEYGDEYKEMYVEFKMKGKEKKDIDISSNLNIKKIGIYIVGYTLKINNYNKRRLYRIVKVIDNEKPVITLQGDNEITLNYGSKYIEQGAIAIDNYDGDITKNLIIKNLVKTDKPGKYEVEYKVSDSSENKSKITRIVIVKEKDEKVIKQEPIIETKDGITYVNGIVLVNKNYGLPKDYEPKVNNEAFSALKEMQADASVLGLDLSLVSGYRSYKKQTSLYNSYVKKDGEQKANTYSAKPGYSEHQTGLAFDIGMADTSFINTKEAKWIEENAHLYGFIVRYPKDKTDITGYIYEPWHVRYLGIDIATKVKESGLCLEEYLGVDN